MRVENIKLLAFLLFACCICTVFSELHKRDVHKIIIKERVPRHHKSVSHSHSHFKSKRHKNKPSSSEEDASSSEESKSSSEEDTFEKISKKKKTREYYYGQSTPYIGPSYLPPLDVAESRPNLFKENSPHFLHTTWLPLNHDHQFHGSFDNPKNSRKKRKQTGGHKTITKAKPNYLNSPVTTYLPHILAQYDISTLYPPLDSYHNGYAKKSPEFSQSPLPANKEQLRLTFSNDKNKYDVKEESLDIPTIISVPEANQNIHQIIVSEPSHEAVVSTSTTIAPNKRGRGNFRARFKF